MRENRNSGVRGQSLGPVSSHIFPSGKAGDRCVGLRGRNHVYNYSCFLTWSSPRAGTKAGLAALFPSEKKNLAKGMEMESTVDLSPRHLTQTVPVLEG